MANARSSSGWMLSPSGAGRNGVRPALPVKPLSADLCLGLGGINAERGEGDHFFFALYR